MNSTPPTVEDLQREKVFYEERIQELEEGLSGLTPVLQSATVAVGERDQLKARIAELEEELAKLRGGEGEDASIVSDLREEVSRAREGEEAAREALSRERENLQAATEEVEALKLRIGQGNLQERLRSESPTGSEGSDGHPVEALFQRQQELKEESERLEAQRADAEEAQKQAHLLLEQASKRHREVEEERRKLREDTETAHREIQEAREGGESEAAELARRRAERANTELEEYHRTVAKAKQEAELAKAEADAAHSEAAASRSEAEASRKSTAAAQREAEAARQSALSAKQEADSLRHSVESLKGSLEASSVAEQARLRAKVAELEATEKEHQRNAAAREASLEGREREAARREALLQQREDSLKTQSELIEASLKTAREQQREAVEHERDLRTAAAEEDQRKHQQQVEAEEGDLKATKAACKVLQDTISDLQKQLRQREQDDREHRQRAKEQEDSTSLARDRNRTEHQERMVVKIQERDDKIQELLATIASLNSKAAAEREQKEEERQAAEDEVRKEREKWQDERTTLRERAMSAEAALQKEIKELQSENTVLETSRQRLVQEVADLEGKISSTNGPEFTAKLERALEQRDYWMAKTVTMDDEWVAQTARWQAAVTDRDREIHVLRDRLRKVVGELSLEHRHLSECLSRSGEQVIQYQKHALDMSVECERLAARCDPSLSEAITWRYHTAEEESRMNHVQKEVRFLSGRQEERMAALGDLLADLPPLSPAPDPSSPSPRGRLGSPEPVGSPPRIR